MIREVPWALLMTKIHSSNHLQSAQLTWGTCGIRSPFAVSDFIFFGGCLALLGKLDPWICLSAEYRDILMKIPEHDELRCFLAQVEKLVVKYKAL